MTLHCTCGSTDIACVKPGSAEQRSETGILVRRDVPVVAMCFACWPVLRGFQQDLFGGVG